MKNNEPGIFPPAKILKEDVSFNDNQHSVTPENLHSVIHWEKVNDSTIKQIRAMMDSGMSDKDIFVKMSELYSGITPEDSELDVLKGVSAPDPVDSTVQGYFDAENQDQGVLRSRNGTGGGMSENRITDPRTRKLAGLPALKEGVNSRLLQQDLKTALMNLSRRGLTLPEIKSMVEQTLLEMEPLVVTASPEDSMDLAAGQSDQLQR